MAAVLSATHLLRRFALFALTLLFLLTMLRAGHALRHYQVLEGEGGALRLFLEGLHVDLGLIGLLLLPVVLLAPLLGMLEGTRALARLLVVVSLTGSLVVVLLAEYITPGVLVSRGVRPDGQVLAALGNAPGDIIASLRATPIPALIGAVLIALIIIAFIARLDTRRLLAYRVAPGQSILLALLGGVVCLAAVWLAATGPGAPSRQAGTVPEVRSDDMVPAVDELALNTTWKLLYAPVVAPVLALISSGPSR